MEARVIHQIWYQGEAALPEKYRVARDKLRAMNPDWTYVLWDEHSLRKVARKHGYEDAYDAGKIMHQRIDLGRFIALLDMGGISIDMDTESLRPLDRFVEEFGPTKLGVTLSSANPIESSIAYMRPALEFFNNATVVCPRPNMPEMKRICDHIARLLRTQTMLLTRLPESFQIQRTTGPLAFTDAVKTLPQDRVEFIAADYFEPCIGFDRVCKPKPHSISNHKHDGTWHGFTGAFVAYYWIKRHIVLILAVVLIYFIVRRRRAT